MAWSDSKPDTTPKKPNTNGFRSASSRPEEWLTDICPAFTSKYIASAVVIPWKGLKMCHETDVRCIDVFPREIK
jgi:hypothetical protein